jgi:hypothetical protein
MRAGLRSEGVAYATKLSFILFNPAVCKQVLLFSQALPATGASSTISAYPIKKPA